MIPMMGQDSTRLYKTHIVKEMPIQCAPATAATAGIATRATKQARQAQEHGGVSW